MNSAPLAILLVSACSYSVTGSGLFHHGGGGGGSSPSTSSGSSSSSGDSPQANAPESGPTLWKQWSVRGISLGLTDRAALAKQGFTCGKRANSRCFKIMDKRCENGGICELHEDAFGQWFELNGAKTDLEFMTVATTESDAALVYDIRLYMVPRQVLATDSALGKALVGKYGTPTNVDQPDSSDKVGGGHMTWWDPKLTSGGPNMQADCTTSHEKQCELEVEDYQVVERERSRQARIDEQRKRASQPTTAPSL